MSKKLCERDESIERIKNNVNFEGFAREDIIKYADENKMNAGDVLMFIIDSLKEHCPYNFFGCSDSEGERLAFKLDYIREALNVSSNPTCQEICAHGCCAYINQILASVGLSMHKFEDNEA